MKQIQSPINWKGTANIRPTLILALGEAKPVNTGITFRNAEPLIPLFLYCILKRCFFTRPNSRDIKKILRHFHLSFKPDLFCTSFAQAPTQQYLYIKSAGIGVFPLEHFNSSPPQPVELANHPHGLPPLRLCPVASLPAA